MISIIKTGTGNIASLYNAILKHTNDKICITNNSEVIKKSTHVFLPGVGAANATMQNIKMYDLLDTIKKLQVPTLGICLGMQILCSQSSENSEDSPTTGINIFNANVNYLKKSNLPLPHMGWNKVFFQFESPLFKNVPNGSYQYFIHSYRVPIIKETSGISIYSEEFSASIEQNNFFGVQFHPEKSGEIGSKIIKNFLNS